MNDTICSLVVFLCGTVTFECEYQISRPTNQALQIYRTSLGNCKNAEPLNGGDDLQTEVFHVRS